MTAPNDLLTPDLPACASPSRAAVCPGTWKGSGRQAKNLFRPTATIPFGASSAAQPLTSGAQHRPFRHPYH